MPKKKRTKLKKEELVAEAVVVVAEKEAPLVFDEKTPPYQGVKPEEKEAKQGKTEEEKDKERGGKRPMRSGKGLYEQAKPEFDQKIIDIRRSDTSVVAGGRRFLSVLPWWRGTGKVPLGLARGKRATRLLPLKAMKSTQKKHDNHSLEQKIFYSTRYMPSFHPPRCLLCQRSRGLITGWIRSAVLVAAGVRTPCPLSLFSDEVRTKLDNAHAAVKALMQVADGQVAKVIKIKSKELKNEINEIETDGQFIF